MIRVLLGRTNWAYVAHAARMGIGRAKEQGADQQMNDYETLRQRHQADAMTLAPRLIERLGWPADRLAAHRAERLRELGRDADRALRRGIASGWRAWTSTAWMRPAWRASDDDQDRPDGQLRPDRDRRAPVAEAGQCPPRDRETGSYLLDGYTAITSGGSSGHRGVFVYDWDGWATYYLGLFRYLLRAKWSDPELASRPVVAASVMAAHFTHATAALAARSPARS